MGQDERSGTAALEQLQATLAAALEVARQLGNDPLLMRMVSAFNAMPTTDRPVIIDVLEREVIGRKLSQATEKAVGQSSRPNPNARLYIRSHESEIDRRALGRDEMMIADIRGMRIATLIRNVPDLYANWKDAMREAMDHVDEPTRAIAEELLRDVLACIAQARIGAQNAGEPPAPESSDADEGSQGS